MARRNLLARWCELSEEAAVCIVADGAQSRVAKALASGIGGKCEIIVYAQCRNLAEKIARLAEGDLLVVALSLETYIYDGANKLFSPFAKPQGVCAKYIFVRLDISEESLLQGLATPKSLVYSKIRKMNRLGNSALNVKNGAGTDISLKVGAFTTCSHEAAGSCGFAFLPPSETSADVTAGTANGEIVVDVTVGQFYYCGELLGKFGLVGSPVRITVQNGFVVDVSGGAMAAELKEKLFRLPEECRELVELGQGLSKMSPTGLIGVDESIIDTCHFGIGDAGKCGLHLDVVLSKPKIRRVRAAQAGNDSQKCFT